MTNEDQFRLGEGAPAWWRDAIEAGRATVHSLYGQNYVLIHTDNGFIKVEAGDMVMRNSAGYIYATRAMHEVLL